MLRGGIVVDPSQNIHKPLDILIKDGQIADISESISTRGRITVDVSGFLVAPGLIDLHTHLREPGYEAKETVLTASRAAAAGGFTGITSLPNTQPVTDDARKVDYIKQLAAKANLVRMWPVGAVTKGSLGEELAEIEQMVKSGIRAVTDDGRGVQTANTVRKALQLCRELDIPLLEHAEDESIAGSGQVHKTIAKKLGIPQIPVTSETVMIARDILLARETGARLHIMHVSAADSVEIIQAAKADGLLVTAEVTPHHLLLTEDAVDGYNAAAKMKPPLRGAADRKALQAGLADGTIDIIATDHAPHTTEEKSRDFSSAPFGIVGLETAFPLLYTYLVKRGIISLETLIDKMSCRPAAIFKLPFGSLKVGYAADIAVFDLQREVIIDKERFYSKGRNTPFNGWPVSGIPVLTMVAGRVIMRNGVVE